MSGIAGHTAIPARRTVTVDGRRLALTNLDKVLYPETGFTKADALDYWSRVATALVPLVAGRPATRKRWVDGVGTAERPGDVFFAKNLEQGAPAWITSAELEHRSHRTRYPLIDGLPTLVWAAQLGALEIHVPQWRVSATGGRGAPDRLVLDLDPGEGVGLAECAEVARLARRILRDVGLDPLPVTSGSKGLHLYATLTGERSAEEISAFAHELARALEADHPDLVVSEMRRAVRRGRVLLDWSQNSAAKTTIAPYSLRGTLRPAAAAPRTWQELAEPSLRQLEPHEVVQRLAQQGDLLAGLHAGADDGAGSARSQRDTLEPYRRRRDAARTPEPVPDAVVGGSGSGGSGGSGRSFVIQEHHARRLHWDLRLERDGVLVSWALPRGVPAPGDRDHLAVHTEDHPLEYGAFEGGIPRGEYGAGQVSIWDVGDAEVEKWRGDEVIATLHGRPDGGLGGDPVRVALIRTGPGRRAREQDAADRSGEQWLIHRMTLGTGGGRPVHPSPTTDPGALARGPSDAPRPQLAVARDRGGLDPAKPWSFEMKWDGLRAVVVIDRGEVRLTSRNELDLTSTYPELAELAGRVGAARAVLDGEVVALDDVGRPSFARLQQRMGLTRPAEVEAARRRVPVRCFLFDLLEVDGESLLDAPYAERRQRLEALVRSGGAIEVPPVVAVGSGADTGPALQHALDTSARLGLEGVVAKRTDSPYSAGRRGSDWVKFKHARAQEVVVGGWRPGAGRRAGGVGSLLLGVPGPLGLEYVGRVGTGFSDRDLDSVARRLAPLARATSPFAEVPPSDARDARWVTPRLVAEVAYAEWTGTGSLRQASWRGWRDDRSPLEVVREADTTA